MEVIMVNMKTRIFKDKNYKAIFNNGKTIRIALDPEKPIQELDYPEFYDVKITDFCTGNCSYCYQNSLPNKKHFENILDKTKSFFGELSENEKPFQVAIGGGNPNQHPDFIELLKTYHEIDIMPNYTTNGIGLTENILEATKQYCGGVAVSCHNHLEAVWKSAIKKLYDKKIKVNLHLIISDQESIDKFINIYSEFKDVVDYFVLLPYSVTGRACEKEIDYEYLMDNISEIDNISKIAFGANFHPYLVGDSRGISISLYEPEILSKYLDMSDMSIHKSSFNLNKK